jgi:hypothetical protein
MKKCIRFLVWCLGCVALTFMGLAIFIMLNKQYLIRKLTLQLSAQLHAKVTIDELQFGWLSTFPKLGIALQNVLVADSLFAQHGQPLFAAENIYVICDVAMILNRNVVINKLKVNGGQLNLFILSNGYSNNYILPHVNNNQRSNTILDLQQIGVSNMMVNVYNEVLKKEFKILIKTATAHLKSGSLYNEVKVEGDFFSHGLGFNLTKGAFLKNVNGHIKLHTIKDRKKACVWLMPSEAKIENTNTVHFSGIVLDKPSGLLVLNIGCNNVDYNWASTLLNQKLNNKIKPYSYTGQVNASIHLQAYTQSTTAEPQIKVSIKPVSPIALKLFDHNVILKHFAFNFNNQINATQSPANINSIINVNSINGLYENFPFEAGLKITNLNNPIMVAHVISQLNNNNIKQLSSQLINVTAGRINFKMDYNGFVKPFYNKQTKSINGQFNATLSMIDGVLIYKNAGFGFNSINGNASVKNNHMNLQKLTFILNGNAVSITGNAPSFMSYLLDTLPELNAYCNIKANTFIIDSLLIPDHKRKNVHTKGMHQKMLAHKIDKLVSNMQIYADLSTNKMTLNPISVYDVRGKVEILNSEIALKNLNMKQADGTVNADINLNTASKNLSIKSNIKNVNMELFLKNCNNFGQDKITHDQIEGNLNAVLNYNVALDNNLKPKSTTAFGTLELKLQNGRLKKMENISKAASFVFKREDLTDIAFQEIKMKSTLKGYNLHLEQLDIASTIMSMRIDGVYSFKNETNISIQLPLKNIGKKNTTYKMTVEELQQYKGPNVFLLARNKPDGSIYLSFDPLKKLKSKHRKKNQ